MVVVKVPTWRVTGSAGGLIPLLALPNVKFDESSNKSVFGVWPKRIRSWAVKAAKGTGGTNPVPVVSSNTVPESNVPPMLFVP
jgi:hypothetical protein